MEQTIVVAFLYTLFAGLATGVGSAIAFFASRTNTKILSFSLGLSAGVMIYVSFVEILHEAQIGLVEELGERQGALLCALAFFGGIAVAALIDKLVPSAENPHEARSVEQMQEAEATVEQQALSSSTQGEKSSTSPLLSTPKRSRQLMRTGMMAAVVIALHNFPEGIATFLATLESPGVGLAIAIAIAIHNVPEGIAVSVPIYYATGSRKKAFWYSLLTGLSEPVGAVVAYLILMPFLSPLLMNGLFAAVAGIMVFISLDELLPAAEKYGEHHTAIYGLLAGMLIMAVSLLLLI